MDILLLISSAAAAGHLIPTAILYFSDFLEFNDGTNIIRGRRFPYNNLAQFIEIAPYREIYEWFLWQNFWEYYFIIRYFPLSIVRALKNRAASEMVNIISPKKATGGELSLSDDNKSR